MEPKKQKIAMFKKILKNTNYLSICNAILKS